jgi:hypothetical protein
VLVTCGKRRLLEERSSSSREARLAGAFRLLSIEREARVILENRGSYSRGQESITDLPCLSEYSQKAPRGSQRQSTVDEVGDGGVGTRDAPLQIFVIGWMVGSSIEMPGVVDGGNTV